MQKWWGFWALSFIWGSSFFLIRVAVVEMSPFQVVFIRTAIAAVGLNILLAVQGKSLPWRSRSIVPLIVLGIGNTTIPFALITWGEQYIESGLASVMQAAVPLFTLIVAHFMFTDEKITTKKIVGLLIGFAGIVVLSSRSWNAEAPGGEGAPNVLLLGQLAVLVAAAFYAFFGAYGKKVIQGRLEPMVVAAGAMTFAALTSGALMVAAPYFNGEPAAMLADLPSNILVSALILGVLNTFVAYILFYWLLPKLGAARTSMVTYVVPFVAVILGVVLLNETIDWRLGVGGGLIAVGIAVVNLRFAARRPAAAGAAA